MKKYVYAVDFPNKDQVGSWMQVEIFELKKDAINFLVNGYGINRAFAKQFISRLDGHCYHQDDLTIERL